jgi:hypothetical protein
LRGNGFHHTELWLFLLFLGQINGDFGVRKGRETQKSSLATIDEDDVYKWILAASQVVKS